MFRLIKKNGKPSRRVGIIKTKSGVVKTPVFMPIATKGAVKNLTPEELKALGANLILGNAYHLWLKPGIEVIKKATRLRPASRDFSRQGGLHNFMNWPGPILTDSGGYQIFSLGAKTRQNGVKINDEGAEFSDPTDGKKHFMTPERSIEIQLALGSDIIMVLDECPAFPCTRGEAAVAVKRTTEWAGRCKKYFIEKIFPRRRHSLWRRTAIPSFTKRGVSPFGKGRLGGIYRPLLFGIVQGSIYKDLRERSARELLKIGFDGYAIGGVAVGEPRKYLRQVLQWVLPLLPENKPRYLMGLGRPEEIVAAVRAGIDMFDCVIPTREARHGRIYINKFPISRPTDGHPQGDNFKFLKNKNKEFYETIQITKTKFAKDFKPLDKNCGCYTCQNFTRAYLHHLFRVGESLAQRLATIHNLKFYLDLMRLLQK